MFSTYSLVRSSVVTLLTLVLFGCNLAYSQTTETLSQSSNPQQLYTEAASAYRQGNFEIAYDKYVELAKSGLVSSDLFYNLGNTALQLNKKGEAVLWYERARRLSPRNTDVLTNLKKVAPYDLQSKTFVLLRPFANICAMTTVSEFLILSAVLIILVGVVFIFYLLLPHNITVKSLFWCLIASCFVSLAFLTHIVIKNKNDYCIIMKPNVVVRSGPGENFNDLTILPEGMKVVALPDNVFKDPDWNQILFNEHEIGFIRKNEFESIASGKNTIFKFQSSF